MSDPGSGERPAGPSALFARDVRRALNVWTRDPRLPITALAIAMLLVVWSAIDTTTSLKISYVALPFDLFFLGFYGVERIWYVRIDRGSPLTWSEVRALNGQLRRRYFGLAFYGLCLVIVPLFAILLATEVNTFERTISIFAALLGLDVLCTFATVDLAFNDATAGNAVRHSIAVLRAQWPKCAWYALVAPLALGIALLSLPRHSLTLPTLLAVDFVLAAFALLSKGATVLFYADRYPTLDDRHTGLPATPDA